jgi:hypothetical protein
MISNSASSATPVHRFFDAVAALLRCRSFHFIVSTRLTGSHEGPRSWFRPRDIPGDTAPRCHPCLGRSAARGVLKAKPDWVCPINRGGTGHSPRPERFTRGRALIGTGRFGENGADGANAPSGPCCSPSMALVLIASETSRSTRAAQRSSTANRDTAPASASARRRYSATVQARRHASKLKVGQSGRCRIHMSRL